VFFNPTWTLSTTAGGNCSACNFAPYQDNFLKNTFNMNTAAEVTVSIRGFNTVNEYALVFDRKPFGRGTNLVYWDGTNAQGQIVHPIPPDSQFIWGMTAFTLPANAIYVDAAPQITDVSASPNYFDPSTRNFLTPENPTAIVQFTLTKSANFVVEVFRVGSTSPIRTMLLPNLAPGANAITWDGRANNGAFVSKGDYRLSLKAQDAGGSQSIVRYLLMRVFY
jgi:hypothetical protein